MLQPVCSIFFHNYYGAHQAWLDYFEKTLSFPANLYYNLAEDSIYNIDSAEQQVLQAYQPSPGQMIRRIIVRQSPNKGKDIGGKMVLLDAYQQLQMPTPYGLLLHDKKSPYKANNTVWADNLFAIASKDFSNRALQVFADEPTTGIITATGNTADEYDHGTGLFKSNNRSLLPGLLEHYQIKPATYQFATGTMFWFRMAPAAIFFKKVNPLAIRAQLETGNITDEQAGTYTHSWERLLSWMITAQHYLIKTI